MRSPQVVAPVVFAGETPPVPGAAAGTQLTTTCRAGRHSSYLHSQHPRGLVGEHWAGDSYLRIGHSPRLPLERYRYS